jgi:hypothetical protein
MCVRGGILSGIRDFGKGLWHGATGVLTQPIKGAKEEGIVGFGKGIGKGVVGIAAKPLAGTFDLISQTADGIKNTTTYFSDNTRERVRPPRYIGEDHVLTPFSKKKSEGKLTLFNLDDQSHQDEHYLWHLEGQVRGTPHLMRAKLNTALTTSFAHFRARVSCVVCGCVVCGREGTRHILLCTDKSCYFINAEDPKKSIWQFPLRGLNRCEVTQGNLVIYLNQSSSANLFEAATTLGTTISHPPPRDVRRTPGSSRRGHCAGAGADRRVVPFGLPQADIAQRKLTDTKIKYARPLALSCSSPAALCAGVQPRSLSHHLWPG